MNKSNLFTNHSPKSKIAGNAAIHIRSKYEQIAITTENSTPLIRAILSVGKSLTVYFSAVLMLSITRRVISVIASAERTLTTTISHLTG